MLENVQLATIALQVRKHQLPRTQSVMPVFIVLMELLK